MLLAWRFVVLIAFLANIVSTLSVYPHNLTYFNELAGGPENGYRHLLHSNLDWGQDLWLVQEWMTRQSIRPDEVDLLPGSRCPARELIVDVPGEDARFRWEVLSAENVVLRRRDSVDQTTIPSAQRIGHGMWAFPIE